MEIKFKRIAPGSYESEDGKFFCYSYNSENRGEGKWWVMYEKTNDEGTDILIGTERTYKDSKVLLSEYLKS